MATSSKRAGPRGRELALKVLFAWDTSPGPWEPLFAAVAGLSPEPVNADLPGADGAIDPTQDAGLARALATDIDPETDVVEAAESVPPPNPADVSFLNAVSTNDEAALADMDLARALVRAYVENAKAVDAAIEAQSQRWRLSRMTAPDRAVLRVAATELLHHPATPAKTALNEAVTLAKAYGTGDNFRFVNALLQDVATAAGRLPKRHA
jgi:transcription antitermination factor NusB